MAGCSHACIQACIHACIHKKQYRTVTHTYKSQARRHHEAHRQGNCDLKAGAASSEPLQHSWPEGDVGPWNSTAHTTCKEATWC